MNVKEPSNALLHEFPFDIVWLQKRGTVGEIRKKDMKKL